tara:strand:- start:20319 stop:20567 length:249 start_codon:yes stop_codon:yes gene_type:complete
MALKTLLKKSKNGCWDAQMIDYDIGAQGSSIQEVISRLEVAFELEKKEGLEDVPAAPECFGNAWEMASRNESHSVFDIRIQE